MIKGLAFVAYAVRDVSKSATFYRDVVGLAPGETFGEDYVEFDTGETTFALDSSPAGYEPGSCSGAAFEVDDITAARARLAENGVQVTDVLHFPKCSACFAKDPDGNNFALHQRTKQ